MFASLLIVQVVTGLTMMTVYTPSPARAWGSVWYLQTQIPWGWLVRGLHRAASDAMLIVAGLALLRMVWSGACRHARLWWIGLALLLLTLAASLTGELLPWDQEGYWGTRVRLNILAKAPLVGEAVKQVLLGGSEPGHLTLVRFYTLHVALLSMAIVLLVRLARRAERSTVRTPNNGTERGDERTALAGALAGVLLVVLLIAALAYGHRRWGWTFLDSPADPTAADYPARPEWHTLFLFQWLKYFDTPMGETFAAIVAPGIVLLLFAAFPWLTRRLPPRVGRTVTGATMLGLLLAMLGLTYAAVRADADPPQSQWQAVRAKQEAGETLTARDQAVLRARTFQIRRRRARAVARRAVELARAHGIPPAGPLELLRNDPLTRGPELFAAHCASCHRYHGHNGLGEIPTEPPDSSDLGDYASFTWIRGLLTDPMDPRYFGRMKKPDGSPAHTRMKKWVTETIDEETDPREKTRWMRDLDAVAAYLEDESVHPRRWADLEPEDDEEDEDEPQAFDPNDPDALLRRGRIVFLNICNECHSYDGERSGTHRAPEMAGYGSVEWIETMIAHPEDESRYRSRGREPAQMPSFADRLSERERWLIAAWLHDTRRLGRPRPTEPRPSN